MNLMLQPHCGVVRSTPVSERGNMDSPSSSHFNILFLSISRLDNFYMIDVRRPRSDIYVLRRLQDPKNHTVLDGSVRLSELEKR